MHIITFVIDHSSPSRVHLCRGGQSCPSQDQLIASVVPIGLSRSLSWVSISSQVPSSSHLISTSLRHLSSSSGFLSDSFVCLLKQHELGVLFLGLSILLLSPGFHLIHIGVPLFSDCISPSASDVQLYVLGVPWKKIQWPIVVAPSSGATWRRQHGSLQFMGLLFCMFRHCCLGLYVDGSKNLPSVVVPRVPVILALAVQIRSMSPPSCLGMRGERRGCGEIFEVYFDKRGRDNPKS